MRQFGQSSDAVSASSKNGRSTWSSAKQIRRVAVDVKLAPIIDQLEAIAETPSQDDATLLRGALLIAKLDNPDIDVDAYLARVESMSQAILGRLAEDADPVAPASSPSPVSI